MPQASFKAIETKYVRASRTKPSRVVATAEGGHRVVLSYDSINENGAEQAHATAAIALCQKVGWTGKLVSGSTKDGFVFCFTKSRKYGRP